MDQQVTNFLYREARLMDSHDYDAWLALWAEDAHYWIPCNADDIDPVSHISLVNENLRKLQDRIERLKSGAAYAQDPKSRLSRVISNIEITRREANEVQVECTFLIAANRRKRTSIVAGRSFYTLRRANDDFQIVRKKVLLVDNDEVISNITFLV